MDNLFFLQSYNDLVNQILINIDGAIFRTLGTNGDVYLRFLKENPNINENDYFWVSVNDNNLGYIKYEKDGDWIKYKSKSTLYQLLNTLCAYGYIQEVIKYNKYQIISKNLSINQITNNLITKLTSEQNHINIYRQSRLIMFLIHLGIINESNKDLIKKVKKNNENNFINLKRLKSEISFWEKEIVNDSLKLVIQTLARIAEYQFLKEEDD